MPERPFRASRRRWSSTRTPISRISAKVIFCGRSDIAHHLADRGEDASTEFLLPLTYSRFCKRVFKNKNYFAKNFTPTPRGAGVTSLWLPLIGRLPFHLPAVPNRFIT